MSRCIRVSAWLAAVVLFMQALSGCASATVNGISCWGDTESPHWSSRGEVLIAKTRYSCDRAAALNLTIRIERMVGSSWVLVEQESKYNLPADPSEKTTYTDTYYCVPGSTYRSGTRIDSIAGLDVAVQWDYAATPLSTLCI